MNTPEFALSHLSEHKLCVSDETHVGVVVFACSGCVCLVGCLVCMIRKIGLYTLSLRYEREYPKLCAVSVVLGIHEISYTISFKIRL